MKALFFRLSAFSSTVILSAVFIAFLCSVFPADAQIYSTQKPYDIVKDPSNKQNISGYLQIAFAWGEQVKPPHQLNRGLINLKEAMNKWTKINTSLRDNLMLSDQRMLAMPFIYVSTVSTFDLTETEKDNVRKYFELGGFMVVENIDPRGEMSQSGASLKRMLRQTIPNARFTPIPNNHEIYNCFFNFSDGPPQGSEVGLFGENQLSQQRFYLEGVWHNGRLVAVYSDKGYLLKWNDGTNNDPQLKMGVNMIVFALTQE